jgi:hypothetical protein
MWQMLWIFKLKIKIIRIFIRYYNKSLFISNIIIFINYYFLLSTTFLYNVFYINVFVLLYGLYVALFSILIDAALKNYISQTYIITSLNHIII